MLAFFWFISFEHIKIKSNEVKSLLQEEEEVKKLDLNAILRRKRKIRLYFEKKKNSQPTFFVVIRTTLGFERRVQH